jgi:hypothetical protein
MQDAHLDGASGPEGGRHHVECVEFDAAAGVGHVHVTRVGTAEPDGGRRRWSLVDLVSAWRSGETFWIAGNDSGNAAMRPSVCPQCRLVSLETEPADALRGLPPCPVDAP